VSFDQNFLGELIGRYRNEDQVLCSVHNWFHVDGEPALLKRLIPRRIKDAIKVLFGSAVAISVDQPDQRGRCCPVCRMPTEFLPLPYSYIKQLVEYQFAYPLFSFETMNYDEYSCRVCGAVDRERLMAMYLEQFWPGCGSILEIAPRPALTIFLRSLENAEVRTADLMDPLADDRVDITNMTNYADNQFDVWICSHVLEHVSDDLKAMRELYRVLKPGGWGLALVPICLTLESTQEDPSITDSALRWKYFGQNDHVRMYCRNDFVSRFHSVGFDVQTFKADSDGVDRSVKSGIDPASVLYVVHRPIGAISSDRTRNDQAIDTR